MLIRSDVAVERALLNLYALQTESERYEGDVKETNGVGFNRYDAEFLSSLAEHLQKKGYLTPRQLVYARERILKYSGQLCKIANGELVVELNTGHYK